MEKFGLPATNKNWQDLLTRESIAKNFISVKSEDTDEDTWYSGSKVYPSKRVPTSTFWATVKKLPEKSEAPYPGVNQKMIELEGQTIEFKKVGSLYNAHGWSWIPEWFDTRNVYVHVLTLPEGTKERAQNGAGINYDGRYAGKVIKVQQCGCGCGCYHADGIYYLQKWLEPSSVTEYKAHEQNLEVR